MKQPTGLSFSQKKEISTALKKTSDQAWTNYNRVSQHIGSNEDECRKAYSDWETANEAWLSSLKSE